MNRNQQIASKIKILHKEQPWMYRFYLSSGNYTPGPKNKGKKNLYKVLAIQNLNLNNKKVLDIGAGEGLFSFYMANENAQVTAFEVNKKRVRKANFIKKELKIDNVTFINDSLENIKKYVRKTKFDIGFCYSIIHRIPDPFNFIAQLSEMCDILVLEWVAPEGFLFDQISFAVHETTRDLDPKNIKFQKNLKSSKSIMDSNLEKPYWNISPAAIMSIASAFGFSHYQIYPIDKNKKIKIFYSFLHLLFQTLIKKNKTYSWRRSKRIFMICSKKKIRPQDLNSKKIIQAKWDATEYYQ